MVEPPHQVFRLTGRGCRQRKSEKTDANLRFGRNADGARQILVEPSYFSVSPRVQIFPAPAPPPAQKPTAPAAAGNTNANANSASGPVDTGSGVVGGGVPKPVQNGRGKTPAAPQSIVVANSPKPANAPSPTGLVDPPPSAGTTEGAAPAGDASAAGVTPMQVDTPPAVGSPTVSSAGLIELVNEAFVPTEDFVPVGDDEPPFTPAKANASAMPKSALDTLRKTPDLPMPPPPPAEPADAEEDAVVPETDPTPTPAEEDASMPNEKKRPAESDDGDAQGGLKRAKSVDSVCKAAGNANRTYSRAPERDTRRPGTPVREWNLNEPTPLPAAAAAVEVAPARHEQFVAMSEPTCAAICVYAKKLGILSSKKLKPKDVDDLCAEMKGRLRTVRPLPKPAAPKPPVPKPGAGAGAGEAATRPAGGAKEKPKEAPKDGNLRALLDVVANWNRMMEKKEHSFAMFQDGSSAFTTSFDLLKSTRAGAVGFDNVVWQLKVLEEVGPPIRLLVEKWKMSRANRKKYTPIIGAINNWVTCVVARIERYMDETEGAERTRLVKALDVFILNEKNGVFFGQMKVLNACEDDKEETDKALVDACNKLMDQAAMYVRSVRGFTRFVNGKGKTSEKKTAEKRDGGAKKDVKKVKNGAAASSAPKMSNDRDPRGGSSAAAKTLSNDRDPRGNRGGHGRKGDAMGQDPKSKRNLNDAVNSLAKKRAENNVGNIPGAGRGSHGRGENRGGSAANITHQVAKMNPAAQRQGTSRAGPSGAGGDQRIRRLPNPTPAPACPTASGTKPLRSAPTTLQPTPKSANGPSRTPTRGGGPSVAPAASVAGRAGGTKKKKKSVNFTPLVGTPGAMPSTTQNLSKDEIETLFNDHGGQSTVLYPGSRHQREAVDERIAPSTVGGVLGLFALTKTFIEGVFRQRSDGRNRTVARPHHLGIVDPAELGRRAALRVRAEMQGMAAGQGQQMQHRLHFQQHHHHPHAQQHGQQHVHAQQQHAHQQPHPQLYGPQQPQQHVNAQQQQHLHAQQQHHPQQQGQQPQHPSQQPPHPPHGGR